MTLLTLAESCMSFQEVCKSAPGTYVGRILVINTVSAAHGNCFTISSPWLMPSFLSTPPPRQMSLEYTDAAGKVDAKLVICVLSENSLTYLCFLRKKLTFFLYSNYYKILLCTIFILEWIWFYYLEMTIDAFKFVTTGWQLEQRYHTSMQYCSITNSEQTCSFIIHVDIEL